MSHAIKSPRAELDHAIKSRAEYVLFVTTQMSDKCAISVKSKRRVRTRFTDKLAEGEHPDADDQIQLFGELLDAALKSEIKTKRAVHAAAKAAARERRRESLKRKPKRLERMYSRKDHKASDKPGRRELVAV